MRALIAILHYCLIKSGYGIIGTQDFVLVVLPMSPFGVLNGSFFIMTLVPSMGRG
jgi:hypothetical protein